MPNPLVIADDDPVVQHILQSILESLGYEVEVWPTGEIAEREIKERAAKDNLPQALFLDMFLGDRTGIEVYQTLLSCADKDDLAVILITSNKIEEMKDYGSAELPEHYLQKPFTLNEVAELMDKLKLEVSTS